MCRIYIMNFTKFISSRVYKDIVVPFTATLTLVVGADLGGITFGCICIGVSELFIRYYIVRMIMRCVSILFAGSVSVFSVVEFFMYIRRLREEYNQKFTKIEK